MKKITILCIFLIFALYVTSAETKRSQVSAEDERRESFFYSLADARRNYDKQAQGDCGPGKTRYPLFYCLDPINGEYIETCPADCPGPIKFASWHHCYPKPSCGTKGTCFYCPETNQFTNNPQKCTHATLVDPLPCPGNYPTGACYKFTCPSVIGKDRYTINPLDCRTGVVDNGVWQVEIETVEDDQWLSPCETPGRCAVYVCSEGGEVDDPTKCKQGISGILPTTSDPECPLYLSTVELHTPLPTMKAPRDSVPGQHARLSNDPLARDPKAKEFVDCGSAIVSAAWARKASHGKDYSSTGTWYSPNHLLPFNKHPGVTPCSFKGQKKDPKCRLFVGDVLYDACFKYPIEHPIIPRGYEYVSSLWKHPGSFETIKRMSQVEKGDLLARVRSKQPCETRIRHVRSHIEIIVNITRKQGKIDRVQTLGAHSLGVDEQFLLGNYLKQIDQGDFRWVPSCGCWHRGGVDPISIFVLRPKERLPYIYQGRKRIKKKCAPCS